jgi:hypothetical protein
MTTPTPSPTTGTAEAKNATSPQIGSSASLGSVEQYIPELWTVEKDAIYAAKSALADGIEYTRELLANHDRDLGRNHRSNKIAAEHMEAAIRGMQAAIIGLRRHAEEPQRADAAEARAARLASALRILIERHEDEVNGGAPITGEEWEIASYALPRIDSDA